MTNSFTYRRVIVRRRREAPEALGMLFVWAFIPMTVLSIHRTGWFSDWTLASTLLLIAFGLVGGRWFGRDLEDFEVNPLFDRFSIMLGSLAITAIVAGLSTWLVPPEYINLALYMLGIIPAIAIFALIHYSMSTLSAYYALRRAA